MYDVGSSSYSIHGCIITKNSLLNIKHSRNEKSNDLDSLNLNCGSVSVSGFLLPIS